MEPSDMLSEELEQIYCMLDILEVIYTRLRDKKEVNLDDLRRVINFFHVFAHRSHNQKEEHVIIPELKKMNNFHDNAVFKEMINESHLAEFYIVILKKLIKDFHHGDERVRMKLITMIKKYLILEKEHVQKEEIYILPLCKQKISKQRYSRIMTEFKLLDEFEFGSGMQGKFHDAFSKVITNLKKQYYRDN